MHDERDVRTNGVERLKKGYDALAGRVPALATMMKTRDGWQRQLGTLGGGNHFIEVCLDELDRVWVMLHSGSRGIGNRIGRHFIALAREEMLALDVKLPDRNLAYLREGTESFGSLCPGARLGAGLRLREPRSDARARSRCDACHPPTFRGHGARNQLPSQLRGPRTPLRRRGSPQRRDPSRPRRARDHSGLDGGEVHIVRGKGNEESFCSCAHGAGRRMSRSQAKKAFTVDDLVRQTARSSSAGRTRALSTRSQPPTRLDADGQSG